MADRPHILIFNPDHYRGDVLGHVGNPTAITPNLDRMVEADGVSFAGTFCQSPVCTPSRCSFMSGWYPHVHGHRTMHHMLRPQEPVLLRTLKENGYFVWWGGKNDLVPAQHGFDGICDVKYRPKRDVRVRDDTASRGEPGSDTFYSFFLGELEVPDGETVFFDNDWANVAGAIDLIRDPPTDRPLCIYLALQYPHPPYAVEEPWFSMIDRGKVPPRIPTPDTWERKPSIERGLYRNYNMSSWSEARWNELRAVAYGMCARVDHQFGLVVDALEEAGLYDETAILFFSDHGDWLGDYGLVDINQNTFEDSLTRVPLIIKPPNDIPVSPGVRDALVELIDVPATIEDFAAIEPAQTHFGRSLRPLIEGKATGHRDAVFCEGGRLEGETHCMELESPNGQHEGDHYWPRLSLQKRIPEHTKAVMCRTRTHKYVRRLYETDELYDLTADPQELHNRIGDPSMAGVLADLKDRLLSFFLECGDVVPHDPDRR